MNPSYYGLLDSTPFGVELFLSILVNGILSDLDSNGCIKINSTDHILQLKSDIKCFEVSSTFLGQISSYYYLQYKTVGMFLSRVISVQGSSVLRNDSQESYHELIYNLVKILCDAGEFSELPVRHNEDLLNQQLADSFPKML
jgi:hypothetical protein